MCLLETSQRRINRWSMPTGIAAKRGMDNRRMGYVFRLYAEPQFSGWRHLVTPSLQNVVGPLIGRQLKETDMGSMKGKQEKIGGTP